MNTFITKFIKGFTYAGVPSAFITAAQNYNCDIHSIEDLKKFGVSIAIGVAAGIGHAVHKAIKEYITGLWRK